MKRKKTMMQVKLLLQGGEETFHEYEKRLNEIISSIQKKSNYNSEVVTLPSASATGRLCCVINYRTQVKK